MSSLLNEDVVRALIRNSTVPVVFRDFVKNWPMCQWTVDKWSSLFGEKVIPFRCLNRGFVSDEPCWERRCDMKSVTFKQFLNTLDITEEWMYFDYKYLHQWFDGDTELFKEVSWKQFGFADKGPTDTTVWVGSSGAHTPAHQDTYGVNIVAQVHGKKRWILFPPDTAGMKPTRVPYEESSVYSELNFYCPNNLNVFNGLSGAHVVELSAGDALLVPRGWWHYVQNMDPLNITLNVWLPHEKDASARVSEALIKILVAQICKDLPHETAKLLVNPNEDDIADTPLAVLFLQLETVSNLYMDSKRKTRRMKRQKTCEGDPTPSDSEDCDVSAILENSANKLEVPQSISTVDLINLINDNIKKYANTNKSFDEDEVDGATANLCLTKAVIDAFSQSNVIELVKQNMLSRLS
ncbi:HSPB1-associated protein 1 isoform X1 [Plodia interpunctella]|uniref:HSPB1-associated protein 1 isoform X1 n=2 Tax=Plodia interpunctella TaxID=58824 RepID=UPI002368AD20|nr:HSPB1-associated protein 1 isoform X1 [Plodia interpunctella]